MFTISLLILSGSLAAPAPDDAAKKAQGELQGTWVAVAGEEKGKKATAEEVKEKAVAITIKGNELTLRQGEDEQRFSFTLDPGKKPAQIDFKQLGDMARPGVVHAIYALEKGELKICFAGWFEIPDEEKERPQEFTTGSSEKMHPPKGQIMVTFKQEKK